MRVIEIERTGPVVRVWLDGVTEDEAADAAREALGTDALADLVGPTDGVFEVIFEAGDI